MGPKVQITNLNKGIYVFQIDGKNGSRNIRVYLPPSYAKNSLKKFPVLYLNDGANLYFDSESTYGSSWRIKSTLDRLSMNSFFNEVIVVGIDNAGMERANEYSPWKAEAHLEVAQGMGGNGDEYGDFIVHELKPVIDTCFRTYPQSEFTLIGGSSMGAFISLYIALKHQNIFSNALIFSPAFWFAKEKMIEFIKSVSLNEKFRCYFYVGTNEISGAGPDEYVNDLYDVCSLMKSKINEVYEEKIIFSIKEGGIHHEFDWCHEFEKAIWFFNSKGKQNYLQNNTYYKKYEEFYEYLSHTNLKLKGDVA